MNQSRFITTARSRKRLRTANHVRARHPAPPHFARPGDPAMRRIACVPSLKLALAGLAVVLGAAAASAGSPKLVRVTPPGGQRGTTVEVELVGKHLDQPKEVVFYEPGI